MTCSERLLAAIEAQQVTIAEQGRHLAQQAEQIGLLVQSVALLLGEELGNPDADGEEPRRLDLDGKPY
ncbi:hypothetical protein [Stenotrophomonas rhizophila]|uniref:hypothetical protein n=1 Tax=Stenotrophomonas rhizophila TaxID=216778 RepID=UPI001AEC34A9|nr:hypothetical protein [Stenotrophomonas rhizophila]